MNQTKKISYPKGLFTMACVNALFMPSLSMTNALLVLYITSQLQVSVKHAYLIYAAFGSLFYSSSLLGGYLGGRFDYKVAIICGCLLAGFGGCLVAIPSLTFVFWGLSCFIIGSGLVVPNLNCITGRLFSKDDPLRDSGFTIAYIGVNVGGFIASISSGFIANYLGYHAAFIASYLLLLLCLIIFLINFKRFEFYQAPHVRPYLPQVTFKNFLPIIFAIIIAVPVIAFLLNHAVLSNTLLITIGIIMAIIIVKIALNEKGVARRKLFGFLIFIFFGIAFWALYMLAPSALTIFIQNNVDRQIGNFIIPTASVYGLNPFFIITLGSLTSWFFFRMSKKNKTLPLRLKFAAGISCIGLGYVILVLGIAAHDNLGYIAFLWVILSYFLQTLGELFVGPIGNSMVGSLVPARLEGMMMGVWQLSTGVAGAISGFLASATAKAPSNKITEPLFTNHIFAHFFGLYGLVTIGVGLLIVLLTPQFKRLWDEDYHKLADSRKMA
ncbi:MAG: hypothetical protein A3E87_08180 [Gammaproteobacteria bacterium RIFCSPHIGHO2_12_FULL_35_23]|nr:MAG: hypothetical protein A3E87_08180 [Gammaproteobacteria bacterium RIFCSPHIGHO2_12_FULL_35_23]